jgi:hypothetical protein
VRASEEARERLRTRPPAIASDPEGPPVPLAPCRLFIQVSGRSLMPPGGAMAFACSVQDRGQTAARCTRPSTDTRRDDNTADRFDRHHVQSKHKAGCTISVPRSSAVPHISHTNYTRIGGHINALVDITTAATRRFRHYRLNISPSCLSWISIYLSSTTLNAPRARRVPPW